MIETPRSLASLMTASARGCSEPNSAAAAKLSSSSSVVPDRTATSVTDGRPTVRVPVLSNNTTSTRWAFSRASALRTKTPASDPFPEPTIMAVGVANPRAQGQAMIITATMTSTA